MTNLRHKVDYGNGIVYPGNFELTNHWKSITLSHVDGCETGLAGTNNLGIIIYGDGNKLFTRPVSKTTDDILDISQYTILKIETTGSALSQSSLVTVKLLFE